MTQPTIMVIGDELDSLTAVELRKRYGNDYMILSETTAATALDRLD